MSIFDFTLSAIEQAGSDENLYRRWPRHVADGVEAVDRHLDMPERPEAVLLAKQRVRDLYTPGHCRILAGRIDQPRRFHGNRISRVLAQHVGGAVLDEKDLQTVESRLEKR